MATTTVSGIPFNISASKSTAATNTGTNLSSDDFMRILLTEMSTPNFGSILGGNEDVGGSGSFFGGSSFSSLLSAGNSSIFNQQPSGTGFSTITELPLLSLLIGKEIKAIDAANNELSGTVQRVLMQNGVAMVDIGGSTIVEPSSITEVK